MIRYIESRRHQPEDRLKTVLNLRISETDAPFAALNALYLFSVENDQLDNVLRILSALILIRKEKVDQLGSLEEFFGYRPGQLEGVMGDMQLTTYRICLWIGHVVVVDPHRYSGKRISRYILHS